MHQIRVHAATSGHPIAGDEKYGDREFNESMRRVGLKRLFLHAYSVAYRNSDGQRVKVLAPLEADLSQAMSRIGLHYEAAL
jgi:23S rRNA pseudouridine955/2504/2580 synthase